MQHPQLVIDGAGAASVAVPGAVAAAQPAHGRQAQPFKLDYAPHFGMFRQSAGEDPIAQLQYMHEMGFRSLEDNGMMGREVALLAVDDRDDGRLGEAGSDGIRRHKEA